MIAACERELLAESVFVVLRLIVTKDARPHSSICTTWKRRGIEFEYEPPIHRLSRFQERCWRKPIRSVGGPTMRRQNRDADDDNCAAKSPRRPFLCAFHVYLWSYAEPPASIVRFNKRCVREAGHTDRGLCSATLPRVGGCPPAGEQLERAAVFAARRGRRCWATAKNFRR